MKANRRNVRNMEKFSGSNVRQNARLRTGNWSRATGHGISRRRFLGTAAAGVVAAAMGLGGVANAQTPQIPGPPYEPDHIFPSLAAVADTIIPGPKGVLINIVDDNFESLSIQMDNLGAEGTDTYGAAGYITSGKFVPPVYPLLYSFLPTFTGKSDFIDLSIYMLDSLVLAINATVIPQLVPKILSKMHPPPYSDEEIETAAQMAAGLLLFKDPQNQVVYAFKDLPYEDAEIILPPYPPFNGAGTGVLRKGRFTIMSLMDDPESLHDYFPPTLPQDDTAWKAKQIFTAFSFSTPLFYYSELCNIIPAGYSQDGEPIYQRNNDDGFDIYPDSAWDQMGKVHPGEDLGPYYPNSFHHSYNSEALPDYDGLRVKVTDSGKLKWVDIIE